MTRFTFTDAASIAVQPGMSVRYPHVSVDLSIAEGNVYSLIGIVRRALEGAAVDRADVALWVMEANVLTDRDQLLTLIMRTVDVR